jgi:hypothetical protein
MYSLSAPVSLPRAAFSLPPCISLPCRLLLSLLGPVANRTSNSVIVISARNESIKVSLSYNSLSYFLLLSRPAVAPVSLPSAVSRSCGGNSDYVHCTPCARRRQHCRFRNVPNTSTTKSPITRLAAARQNSLLARLPRFRLSRAHHAKHCERAYSKSRGAARTRAGLSRVQNETVGWGWWVHPRRAVAVMCGAEQIAYPTLRVVRC